MKISEMEDQLKVIDARTLRIEQTMVTKDDLKAYATRAELKAKIDLAVEAMQLEMTGLAARSDRIEARLATVATKQQLDEAVSKLATKQELDEAVSTLAAKLNDAVVTLGKQIGALKPRKARTH